MNTGKVREILESTDFIHLGGSPEEKKVAAYLQSLCEEMDIPAHTEPFPVAMTEMVSASLTVSGREIPCKGYKLCGTASVEAPFLYMPNRDRASLAGVKGRIVLLDGGLPYWVYQDLVDNGAAGFITYDGDLLYADRDIDHKELRPYVSLGRRIPGVNINAKDALALVQEAPETVRISVEQTESEGESLNVVADLPGETDETIIMTAHFDTTSLSHGAYDNMTGCIGLLGVMEALKGTKHRRGIRFVFCGSEERGLLGSKAYVKAHEEELGKTPLVINLDMIGTWMGKFICCVSAEEKLVHHIQYLCAEQGFGIEARQGVYSSDSTPFADGGVPALSFARITTPNQSHIHSRYDTAALVSDEQMLKDIAFIASFTGRMADAVVCPVAREIPDKVKTELDEYMNRKRKN
ncbi:MAG: M28 family metallopeptidase [Clostridia bacterium]|nr:M28 family metallopeptidase [Clostridia bacterium]